MCCSVLQCVAACCSVLQCVAVRCSVLQCVAVRCSALQCVALRCRALQGVAVRCSALQCVSVCERLPLGLKVPCVAMCCNMLRCVAMCCPVKSNEILDFVFHSILKIYNKKKREESNECPTSGRRAKKIMPVGRHFVFLFGIGEKKKKTRGK